MQEDVASAVCSIEDAILRLEMEHKALLKASLVVRRVKKYRIEEIERLLMREQRKLLKARASLFVDPDGLKRYEALKQTRATPDVQQTMTQTNEREPD